MPTTVCLDHNRQLSSHGSYLICGECSWFRDLKVHILPVKVSSNFVSLVHFVGDPSYFPALPNSFFAATLKACSGFVPFGPA